jgi:hypothetical protein
MNDDQALRGFVAKYARPYDPASDDYDRPPFGPQYSAGVIRYQKDRWRVASLLIEKSKAIEKPYNIVVSP